MRGSHNHRSVHNHLAGGNPPRGDRRRQACRPLGADRREGAQGEPRPAAAKRRAHPRQRAASAGSCGASQDQDRLGRKRRALPRSHRAVFGLVLGTGRRVQVRQPVEDGALLLRVFTRGSPRQDPLGITQLRAGQYDLGRAQGAAAGTQGVSQSAGQAHRSRRLDALRVGERQPDVRRLGQLQRLPGRRLRRHGVADGRRALSCHLRAGRRRHRPHLVRRKAPDGQPEILRDAGLYAG